MRNERVVRNFIYGAGSGRGSNLYIEGDVLINYTTPIAMRFSDTIVINTDYYSQTTAVHQNRLKRIASADEQLWVSQHQIESLINGNRTLDMIRKEAKKPSAEEVANV